MIEKIVALLPLGSFALGIFVLFFVTGLPKPETLTRTWTVAFPSFAASDDRGGTWVIDNSQQRITKIGPGNKVEYILSGGGVPGNPFFYAIEIVPDQKGRLFVLNQIPSDRGFQTAREEILFFDEAGRYLRTLWSRDYREDVPLNFLVNRGMVTSLAVSGDVLSWFVLGEQGMSAHQINISTGMSQEWKLLPDITTHQLVASAASDNHGTFYFVTKTGELRQVGQKGNRVLFQAAEAAEFSVPWWLAYHNGIPVFSDLTRREIFAFSDSGVTSLFASPNFKDFSGDDFPYIYYKFQKSPGGLLTTVNDAGVLVVGTDRRIIRFLVEAELPLSGLLIGLVPFVILGAVVFLGLWNLWVFYVHVLHKKISLIIKLLVLVIPPMSLIFGWVLFTLLNFFSAQNVEIVSENIKQMISAMSQNVDTAAIEQIDTLADYMGKDYSLVRSRLQAALGVETQAEGNKLYFALHRVFRGKIYTMMFLNDAVSPFHPFTYLNDPNELYVGALHGVTATKSSYDAWGQWLYGVGPIRNAKGQVVALLEVGTNLFAIQQKTNRMLEGIVPSLGFSGFLFALFFAVVSWLLLGSLRTLRDGVNQVAGGKWGVSLPIRGSDEVAQLTVVFNRMSTYINNYIQEILALSKGYRRFVPQEFLRLLNRENIKEIHLGDQIQKEMTVLFSDIRSFTTISEKLNPKENFDFLNSYLGLVGPEVRKNGGFIDKYIGDAIMALYPNSPRDAIQTGVEITRRLKVFNKEREAQGLFSIEIGIGIHTGNLTLGVLGEEERMDGTVVSDNVNLASRLEGLTKYFRAAVIVSEASFNTSEIREAYLHRYLGKILVTGKSEPIGAFEILEGLNSNIRDKKVGSKPWVEQGIAHFQKCELEDAQKNFLLASDLLPTDPVPQIYLQVLQAIGRESEAWTGALNLVGK